MYLVVTMSIKKQYILTFSLFLQTFCKCIIIFKLVQYMHKAQWHRKHIMTGPVPCPKWRCAVVRVALRALAYRVSSSCHALELGLRLSERLRWSQLWPVAGVAALGLSVQGNVFAPLYSVLENPHGMCSRTSLVCLGDAGVYSVLVAYTQLWDSGVAWTCASDMPSSWCLARTLITTVSLFVCYALGVIVTNDWCFFILFILLSLSHAFCVVIYMHTLWVSHMINLWTFEPLIFTLKLLLSQNFCNRPLMWFISFASNIDPATAVPTGPAPTPLNSYSFSF